MTPYLIICGVAAAASFLSTPLVRRLAVKVGGVAIPSDRKVHLEPTPQMGGLAIFTGIVAALLVAWTLPAFRTLFRESSEPVGVVLAASAVVLLGSLDDIREMRARTKLAGHLLAAGILVLFGVQVLYFWIPGVGVLSLSTDLAAVLTVLWTVALINAVNLIDGLDGLATGVAAIGAAAFFVYAHRTTGGVETTAELLTAIVVGASLGFLPHNFNPARIFMGDSGSYLLGLILASATVSGISRTTEPQFIDVAGYIVPVLLPLFVLAIPLVDASFAIMRRMREGRPVFHPDKQHIHHWLFEMAGSHRRAVLVMYLWSAMLAGSALALALGPGLPWRIVAAGIGAALVASIVVLPRMMRRTSAPPSPAAVAERAV